MHRPRLVKKIIMDWLKSSGYNPGIYRQCEQFEVLQKNNVGPNPDKYADLNDLFCEVFY